MTVLHELEFDGKHPDFAGIEEAVRTRGCALIRGVYRPDEIEPFNLRAHRAYAAREWMDSQGLLPEDLALNLRKFNHIRLSDLDASCDNRYELSQVFAQTPLVDLGKQLVGDDSCLSLIISLPRRQNPPSSADMVNPVPFHQDGSFLGESPLILNFWTPLTTCGVDCPGLELVTVGLERLLPTYGEFDGQDPGAYQDIDISEAFIDKLFGKRFLWHPEIRQGDVMLFSHLTLHRTYMTPDMNRTRISAELRCASKSQLSSYYAYEVLQYENRQGIYR